MNLEGTIVPDSTQINADDLIGQSRTFTIESVSAGNAEQPVNIHLKETERAYRPGKSMRRVLVAAWGKDSAAYAGRQLTLFNDPTVKWAGVAVGGVRISHLSDIGKPLTVALTETRGRRKPFVVQPLATTPQQPAEAPVTPPNEWRAHLAAINTLDALNSFYQSDAKLWWTDDVRDAFTARKKALTDV